MGAGGRIRTHASEQQTQVHIPAELPWGVLWGRRAKRFIRQPRGLPPEGPAPRQDLSSVLRRKSEPPCTPLLPQA